MKPEYLTILKKILNETVPEKEFIVFMFGSRVAKNNHDRSDIDIGLWGNKTFPSELRFALEEKIENSIIPYKVELVDFSRVEEYFKKKALQHIELWNCPKSLEPSLLSAIDDRNQVNHIYREETYDIIYETLPGHLKSLENLLKIISV